MQSEIIGRSVSGQGIFCYRWPGPGRRVLIVAGTHGNEVEGIVLAEALRAELLTSNPYQLNLAVIPNHNPDGVGRLQRVNENSVDLNRNMPTKDWNPQTLDPKYPPGPSAGSEPEVQALLRFLEKFKPEMIISLHSFSNFMLNTNGECQALAEAIQKVNGYKISPSIGYPTPGSLGTWAATDHGIPCLTYELERGLEFKKIIEIHLPSLMAGLNFLNEGRS